MVEKHGVKSLICSFNPRYLVIDVIRCEFNLQIVVNNAPDLRDRNERLRVQSMAHAFANTKYSIGGLLYEYNSQAPKYPDYQ